MRAIMRTKVVITEERELEITQDLCDEFCGHIARSYEAEFEPITPEDIEKYDGGEESKLDQVGIFGGRKIRLGDLWYRWIRDVLCDDGDYYEIDRDYIDDEILYKV